MPDFASTLSSTGPVRLRRAARLLVPALLAGALLAPGCGNGTPTIPGGSGRSAITITVAPNPVTSTQDTTTFAVTASYTITVKETAGLGGEVQFISSAAYEPSTGAQVALNYYDSTDLVVYQGSKRIEANGELTLQQSVTYTLADYSKAADLVVSMQLKDDRTNLDFASLLVKIQ
jgi:hypothetical protein